MKEWFDLSEEDKRIVINQVSGKTGLLPAAIEKDWWVMIALRAVFNTKYAEHLVFKGGTSLSKAYAVIERFSEDIDLAIDRSFFEFTGKLSRTQVKNLRKASSKFAETQFKDALEISLIEQGVKDFKINVIDFEESDTDPVSIELEYKSITETIEYLKPRILIEISSRSLRDPFENKNLISFIGEAYPEQLFTDKSVIIPTVHPKRTFLEKIFLLHEEFQKPKGKKIRSDRMSRHLYDISKLMDTKYCDEALDDRKLYDIIVAHREMLTKISWVDYAKHSPQTLDFIPPESVIKEWERDYLAMKESMFYGETDTFEDLIIKLMELKGRFNSLK